MWFFRTGELRSVAQAQGFSEAHFMMAFTSWPSLQGPCAPRASSSETPCLASWLLPTQSSSLLTTRPGLMTLPTSRRRLCSRWAEERRRCPVIQLPHTRC